MHYEKQLRVKWSKNRFGLSWRKCGLSTSTLSVPALGKHVNSTIKVSAYCISCFLLAKPWSFYTFDFMWWCVEKFASCNKHFAHKVEWQNILFLLPSSLPPIYSIWVKPLLVYSCSINYVVRLFTANWLLDILFRCLQHWLCTINRCGQYECVKTESHSRVRNIGKLL